MICSAFHVHVHVDGVRLSLNCSHQLSIPQPPDDYMSMESHGIMILIKKNWRTQRETCSTATVSIRNPTWSDPGANPGFCGETLVTYRLSHGTALFHSKIYTLWLCQEMFTGQYYCVVFLGELHVFIPNQWFSLVWVACKPDSMHASGKTGSCLITSTG
jgi:hypothetical protein